jgi:Heavy metal binding domain
VSDTPNAPGPKAAAVSRWAVFAIRVLLLLVVLAAATFAAVSDPLTGRTTTRSRYICPMHPDVITTEPGQCPICRMALEPIRQGSSMAMPAPAEPTMDADWRAVENVRRHDVVDIVRSRSLLFDLRELRAPASVESDGSVSAIFYDDQIAAFSAGEVGSFSPAAEPKAAVSVQRSAATESPWDSSTSRIRFELRPAPGEHRPPPGTVGWLELPRKQRQVLTVPTTAVLHSSAGPYVLELTEAYHFKKQAIEIGETFGGLGVSVVLSGLRPGERVISKAAFFLDTERRQNAALGGAAR